MIGAGSKDIKMPSGALGKEAVPIYLLDNSFKTLLISAGTTVEDVLESMSKKLGFKHPENEGRCFTLHPSPDGVVIERAMELQDDVLSVKQSWDPSKPAKFVYVIQVTSKSLLESEDPAIINLLFVQSVYNVITGFYPLMEDEAFMFAGIQLAAKFGAHDPGKHRVGFLAGRVQEYIPKYWMEHSKKDLDDMERAIYMAHKKVTALTPKQLYIECLRNRKPYFGTVMYMVKQRSISTVPKIVLFAISPKGVQLLRPADMKKQFDHELLRTFDMRSILRWSFTGRQLKIDVKESGEGPDAVKEYFFDTKEAKDIAFSLKSNAMGFMRDMGIGPDGAPLQRATHDKEAEEVSIDTILSSARREAVKKMMSPPAAAPAPAPAPATRAAAMPTSTDAEYKDTEAAEQYAAEEVEGGEVEEEQLPPGWMKLYDESSGYYYYYNEETGESLWEPPTGEY